MKRSPEARLIATLRRRARYWRKRQKVNELSRDVALADGHLIDYERWGRESKSDADTAWGVEESIHIVERWAAREARRGKAGRK